MKLYIPLIISKILLVGIFPILLQFTSAQAQIVPFLVSTNADDKLCQGDSITFLVTPLPPATTFPKFMYIFSVNGTELAPSAKNSYKFIATPNFSNTEVEIKAKISSKASADATPVVSVFSNVIKFKVNSVKTPVIKQLTPGGWANLPDDIFSTADPIILDARENKPGDGQGDPLPPHKESFFTGEAIKRTGPNEYKFFPSFATPGINTIFYTYIQEDHGCTKTVQATITVKANSGAIKGLTPSLDINCVNNKENPVSLNFENESFPFDCYEFNSCYSYTVTYNLISITGNGISGDLATGFKFNPQKARAARDMSTTDVSITYSITYRKKSLFGIEFDVSTTAPITVTEKVNLYTVDELQITNSGQEFVPSSSFCRTDPVILTGIPSSIAGKFSIKKPARSDGSIPSVETRGTPYEIPWRNDVLNYPAGEYEITYKYTNPNGCESVDKVIKFTLKEVPAPPTFERLVYNYCVGDSILPLTFEAGPGLTTLWRKGDPNATDTTTTIFNPKVNNTFANSVNIYVSQYNGTCESTQKTITIHVSPKPDANFVHRNVCQGGPTEFVDKTVSNGNTISKKIWDFGDGDILPEGTGNIPPGIHGNRTSGTYDNPQHTYQLVGTYQVTLTLVTSACPDSETKPVYIFPIQNSFPYLETFENGAGGWLPKSDTTSSWKLLQPIGTRITPDITSPHAWVTSNVNTSYNSPENSFVESPCFQLDSISKPYLSINITSDTEEGLDGAVLQYTIDNGNTFTDQLVWKVLGNRNQGINWYTTSGIVGNPGGQSTSLPAIGWSGYVYNKTDVTKWVTAKFDLGQVKQEAGNASVRFRIAFGSNADNPPNRTFDGFAFDNFIIGEINRIVLLEHFTNTSQPDFIQENQKVYETVNANDIASIQYHTSFPAADPINEDNPSDPSARALLYGIAESNRTVLDGSTSENKAFSTDEWGKNAYSKRILFEAPFTIDINLTGGENDPLKIDAAISKNLTLEDINSPLVVQVAIVEKEVTINTDVFQNVLKRLLPDAAGNRLTGLWKAADETRTEVITHTWLPGEAAAPNTLAVIVFVQDENTKEVYQARQELIPVALKADPSGGRNGIATGWDSVQDNTIRISPNPASSEVHLSFSDPIDEDFTFILFDALGKSVASGKIQKGSSRYVLQIENYPNGMYLIQVAKEGSNQLVRRKLSILH